MLEIFDFITEGMREDSELVDIINGMVWCEIESTYQDKPTYSRFLFALDGIGVWYDYGADYHFFTHEG